LSQLLYAIRIITGALEKTSTPPGRPRSTRLRNINDDPILFDMELAEARDEAQKRHFWRMLASYSATHAQWCMLVLDWMTIDRGWRGQWESYYLLYAAARVDIPS